MGNRETIIWHNLTVMPRAVPERNATRRAGWAGRSLKATPRCPRVAMGATWSLRGTVVIRGEVTNLRAPQDCPRCSKLAPQQLMEFANRAADSGVPRIK